MAIRGTCHISWLRLRNEAQFCSYATLARSRIVFGENGGCLSTVADSARTHHFPPPNRRFTSDALGGFFADCPDGITRPVAGIASVEASASGDFPSRARGPFSTGAS